MFSSYNPEDVEILLKDITGLVRPLSTRERERRIQSGTPYSEMLPIEYVPTEAYMNLYQYGLEQFSDLTARAVESLSAKICERKQGHPVLVSLARAGTSIGVLIRSCIRLIYGTDVPHYTISIIRGQGIDRNAMREILRRHPAGDIQFVDGWTGKGAISRELSAAMRDFPGVDPGLAVLSDPAGAASLRGTWEDFLIPSSCLNSVVSGLLSRTFYRKDLIGEGEYHGAAFYRELREQDLPYAFIDRILAEIATHLSNGQKLGVQEAAPVFAPGDTVLSELDQIQRDFAVRDRNLIKPGIGETTRVLLRRLPWKVLISSREDKRYLGHLYQLAKEKGVETEVYPLRHYRASGIIRNLADT